MSEVFRTIANNKTEQQAAQEFAESFPEPRKVRFIGHHTFKLVDGSAEYKFDLLWGLYGKCEYSIISSLY
jgi:hypothetical protein